MDKVFVASPISRHINSYILYVVRNTILMS